MRNKKIISIIGIVFIATVLFFIFGTPRYHSIKVKSENFVHLENKLKEASNANSEMDIKKLTNFDWDECYVFTPYYPAKGVYEKIGTEWTTSKTFIEFLMFHNMENHTVNDDQYLIVFKNDNKVVLSKIYSLNQLPVIFKLDNYKFTSSNAIFLVSVAKQYDEGKIKELVIKN